jgi:hypothetical protein
VLTWLIPQTQWLGDADGRLLVDDVLRFERLDHDWTAFCERHGLERELAHINASPGSADLCAAMTSQPKRGFADCLATDFETFGFAE